MNRLVARQTSWTHIRRRVTRRLIWIHAVCQVSTQSAKKRIRFQPSTIVYSEATSFEYQKRCHADFLWPIITWQRKYHPILETRHRCHRYAHTQNKVLSSELQQTTEISHICIMFTTNLSASLLLNVRLYFHNQFSFYFAKSPKQLPLTIMLLCFFDILFEIDFSNYKSLIRTSWVATNRWRKFVTNSGVL